MYHERQWLQHCLKHAINNLLQHEAFSTTDLNKLCDSIQACRTWVLGNYDANVLMAALATHSLEVEWLGGCDALLSALHLSKQATGEAGGPNGARSEREVVGLVVNVATTGLLSALFAGRHWFAVKCIDGLWWNLDSKLAQPESFAKSADDAAADGGVRQLHQWLQQQLQAGTHLMAVYRTADGGGQGTPGG